MWCSELGAVVAAALLLVGCGGAPEHTRTDYAIGAAGRVLFSNSLVVQRRVQPQRTPDGSLVVEYAVTFQNEGAELAQIALADAYAFLDGEPDLATVRCAARGAPRSHSLNIAVGQRVRVDCVLGLTANGIREARSADRELAFRLPVLSAGQLVTLTFAYRLSLEDLA
jgi:hypothetical protein